MSSSPENNVVAPPNREGIFTITKGNIVYNNNCETVWEAYFQIPEGLTAVATGIVSQGNFGSFSYLTNPQHMILSSETYGQGFHRFSVHLGNSGSDNVESTYGIKVELNDGDVLNQVFKRTAFQSPFYDKAPC